MVAVNKMDSATVNYSEERYTEIKGAMQVYLRDVGFDVTRVDFIPISGWVGDNIVERSKKMPWWKGPTLIESLDRVQAPMVAAAGFLFDVTVDSLLRSAPLTSHYGSLYRTSTPCKD